MGKEQPAPVVTVDPCRKCGKPNHPLHEKWCEGRRLAPGEKVAVTLRREALPYCPDCHLTRVEDIAKPCPACLARKAKEAAQLVAFLEAKKARAAGTFGIK